MLLIYTHTISKRLEYTVEFIFNDVFKCPYRFTTQPEEAAHYDGPCIVYDNIQTNHFKIIPHGLLFEENIKEQYPEIFTLNTFPAIFRTNGQAYPFDIFSAVFYLISRYEEYLPFKPDLYGRFSHEQSLAHQAQFLHIPLINYWLRDFIHVFHQRFPGWQYEVKSFQYVSTYDVDMAYSYRYKGVLRNIGGWLKNPNLERLLVLSNNKKDPYDTFQFIQTVTDKRNIRTIVFYLCAANRSRYDKNIPLSNPAIQSLITGMKGVETGIHPSYYSMENIRLIQEEQAALEQVVQHKITASRQHYLRFRLPDTYRMLADSGITDEYSMGYGSINGFRASVCTSFYWFDLLRNNKTELRIHPFCFMDANSIFEQHQSMETTYQEMLDYMNVCKSVHGTFISILHNHLLNHGNKHEKLKDVYTRFLASL